MHHDQDFMRKLEQAVEEWSQAVEQDEVLTINGKSTYIDHPKRFLRWLKGEYILPGDRL